MQKKDTKPTKKQKKRRKKVGRPTKYTPKMLKKAKEYLNECKKNKKVPYLSELALFHLNVHRETVLNWMNEKTKSGKLKHPEFFDAIKKIKTLQRFMLEHGAISGQLTPAPTIFLLKANHGMQDRQQVEHVGKDGQPLFPVNRSEPERARHKKLLEEARTELQAIGVELPAITQTKNDK